MSSNFSEQTLTEVIDKLAPLNNRLRNETNPIKKIEIMWDLGKIIDNYTNRYNLKLHELLYKIYDPHSTIKASNITRDLGSYSYRIYKYYKTKEEIRKSLKNLKSYGLFREAVPLLFNPKYEPIDKNKMLALLNSNIPPEQVKALLIKMKKNTRLIKNPRSQKAYIYKEEVLYLRQVIAKLKYLYEKYDQLPSGKKINDTIGNKNYRKIVVKILSALSNDALLGNISNLKEKDVPASLSSLFKIAKSKNINRSRFRRWALSSNKLLSLAEGIHALNNNSNYIFYKKKLLDRN